jgi:hypothetical protein
MDTFAKLQLFTLRTGRIELMQHHFRDLQSLPQSRRIAIPVPRDSPCCFADDVRSLESDFSFHTSRCAAIDKWHVFGPRAMTSPMKPRVSIHLRCGPSHPQYQDLHMVFPPFKEIQSWPARQRVFGRICPLRLPVAFDNRTAYEYVQSMGESPHRSAN